MIHLAGRRLSDSEAALLWARRAEPEVRARLIEAHRHLVPATRARTVPTPPPRVSAEDLESEGYLALVKAVDAYAPERGVRFISYAVCRIRGAMLELLRREDWVPRTVRTAQRQLRQAEASGAAPETLAALEVRAREVRLVSLDQGAWSDGAPDENNQTDALDRAEVHADPSPDPETLVLAELARQALVASLWDEVRRLPPLQQRVCALRYGEGCTFGAIGGRLQRSESRVQQLHTLSLARLRERLSGELTSGLLG